MMVRGTGASPGDQRKERLDDQELCWDMGFRPCCNPLRAARLPQRGQGRADGREDGARRRWDLARKIDRDAMREARSNADALAGQKAVYAALGMDEAYEAEIVGRRKEARAIRNEA